MQVYEVTLAMTAYVSVDGGTEDAIRELVRDKVAAGPCLFVAEGKAEGARPGVGHYLVKGLSVDVVEIAPFVPNRRVIAKEDEDAQD
jgi:hypothetical protein